MRRRSTQQVETLRVIYSPIIHFVVCLLVLYETLPYKMQNRMEWMSDGKAFGNESGRGISDGSAD